MTGFEVLEGQMDLDFSMCLGSMDYWLRGTYLEEEQ